MPEPAGMRVRLSEVGVRSTAAGVALCGLLAACGQATLTTPPADGQRSQLSTSRGPSAAANRHAAQREALRLLSLARVPPGAVAVSSHPSSLDGPVLGMTAASSLVDRTRFWRVPTGLDATIAWFRAHPPRGLKPSGSSSGGGPAYQGQPAYLMVGVGYSEPDRQGIQDLELAIGVATLPGGGSAIRADGMAIWLDPRPIRDDGPGRRMRVTVAEGCPARDTRAVGVRSPAGRAPDLDTRLLPAATPTAAAVCDFSGMNGHPANGLVRSRLLDQTSARKLARAVGALALGHPLGEVFHCPFADGTASVLAFSYQGRPDVDLWMDRNGCAYVSNGRIMTRVGNLATAVMSGGRAVA